MPLLCDLGWHRPRPMARWNEGFYFTTCARCACDLVRTAYGRWGAPRGYRVVWQAAAPRNAVTAALVRNQDGGSELPIQEVLRHLHDGDPDNGHAAQNPENDPVGPGEDGSEAGTEEPIAPAATESVRPKAFSPSRIPDFMDRPTRADAWEAQPRSYLIKAAPVVAAGGLAPPPAPETPDGREEPGWLQFRAQGLVDRIRSAAAAFPDDGSTGHVSETRRARRTLLAIIPIFAALFALLIWATLRESAGPSGVESEMPAGFGSGEGAPAYVAASVLNCRAGPAREARSVTILARGVTQSIASRA